MKFAYNTNGWRGHTIEATIQALSSLGYDAIEIAPQADKLSPDSWAAEEARRIRTLAADAGLTICNLHAGARDLLDSRFPHEPSLISTSANDRSRRLILIQRAIDFAAELGTDLVCITSGPLPQRCSIHDARQRLKDGLHECLAYADQRRIRLAIEPEPELFVRLCLDFLDVHQALGTPGNLGLNLDIGHAQVMYEDTPAIIRELSELLWHVHFEDIANRVHEHLPPGRGQVDFHAVGRALSDIGYAGAVSVELMNHSHQAVEMAINCLAVMRTWRRSYGRRPQAVA